MIDLISQAHAEGPSVLGGDYNMMSFLPFILIIAIMYFLIIRPQSKRAKEHKAMIEALKRGDKVITSGGLIGTVTGIVDQNEVMVELTKDVEVRLVRSSITQVLSKTGTLTGSTATQDKDEETQSSVKQMIQKKAGKKPTAKK